MQASLSGMEPFALLDDAPAGRATLLSGLVSVAEVTLDTLDAALAEGWARGLHCLAWLPYGLGEAALGVGDPSAAGALYWFDARREVDPAEVLPPSTDGWLIDASHDVTAAGFAGAVGRLQEEIASGSSYQINYTHRVTGRLAGDPTALYARLRAVQPVEFGLLAHLPVPASAWTLSLSPELFLNVTGGTATSRPMKGTADAATDPAALSSDPKNRAENLMIVDLIRNDLSKVSRPGTVVVDRLFDVERVGRLWQMTSSVSGALLPGTTPADLLRAMFPCGSITGAPKLASMRLIRDVEPAPRGLYTGALGVIDPEPGPTGWRMTLSVVIRTIEVDADGNARLGVGSGIVADSTAAAEWEECLAKVRFAIGAGPDLHLREAMRVVDGVAPLADRHRARLVASAAALGLPAPGRALDAAVAETPAGAWRVGLDLAPDGTVTVNRRPLERPDEAVLLLAREPWTPGALARFKTSQRALYDDAILAAAGAGAFDVIGHDAEGRVLEGGRTSVFARIDGRWVTPPLTLGILDGVQRAEVLDHPALLGVGPVVEDEFTVDDLRRADAIAVTNAVVGVVAARLEES